jgi:hypothetical protein
LSGQAPVPHAACGRKAFAAAGRKKTTKGKNVAGKYELCLRLSPEEKQRLEEDAKRCRLSKSVYLRSLITGTPVRARPSQEIKDLRKEVHQIGNNINQIARSVNAGIADAGDAKRALSMLNRVYELMYEIAQK